MRDIDTFELPVLMERLFSNEEPILEAIEADPMIKKRRVGRLTIANAGKGLGKPVEQHQLYAKGIVYEHETLKVVSLPMIKMHNHGMDEVSDRTTRKVLELEGAEVQIARKLDGTMIQSFVHDGVVMLATRGVLEGDDENQEYIELAWDALREARVHMCPELHYGLTITYELICPEARVITRYGEERKVVIHGATLLLRRSVASPRSLSFLGDIFGVEVAQSWDCEPDEFDAAVAARLEEVQSEPGMQEGLVVSVTRGRSALHRVKVKTRPYVELHAFKYNASLKSVSEKILEDMSRVDWGAFRRDFLDDVDFDEETISVYKGFHREFSSFVYKCSVEAGRLTRAVNEARSELGEPSAREDYGKFVAKFKVMGLEGELGLLMRAVRDGGSVSRERVMWSRPLFPGMRHMMQEMT